METGMVVALCVQNLAVSLVETFGFWELDVLILRNNAKNAEIVVELGPHMCEKWTAMIVPIRIQQLRVEIQF